jgi:hypothetical protein
LLLIIVEDRKRRKGEWKIEKTEREEITHVTVPLFLKWKYCSVHFQPFKAILSEGFAPLEKPLGQPARLCSWTAGAVWWAQNSGLWFFLFYYFL